MHNENYIYIKNCKYKTFKKLDFEFYIQYSIFVIIQVFNISFNHLDDLMSDQSDYKIEMMNIFE